MNNTLIPIERIENIIYTIRGQRVMLDEDLAILYCVEIKVLNQAVKRNTERFPSDFMFQLTRDETEVLRSQIVTLKTGRGKHRKYLPYAFTEHGVAMLSSVLRSPKAIAVNIEIIRAFIRMRHLLESNKELAKMVTEMRSFMIKNSNKVDQEFNKVWKAIEKLSTPPAETRRIGFCLEPKQ